MDPLSIVGTGVSLGKSIVGIFESHPDDPQRLADNARAVSLATSGNRGGLEFLKGRSGKFGVVVLTQALSGMSSKSPSVNVGNRVSGWATEKARNDAYNKAQSIGTDYAALGGGQNATPKQAADNPVGQPRDGNAGNVGPTLAGVVPEAVTKYAPYILAGITVLWAVKYARKMR